MSQFEQTDKEPTIRDLWKAFGRIAGETPGVNYEGEVGMDHELPRQSFEPFADGSALLTLWAFGRDEAVSKWRHERDALVQS